MLNSGLDMMEWCCLWEGMWQCLAVRMLSTQTLPWAKG